MSRTVAARPPVESAARADDTGPVDIPITDQATSRLEARDLGYRVGDRWLIEGVSLRVAPGEFVGVVGPNGAGKSTLLRSLAGLLAPARGRVTLEGRDLRTLEPSAIARIVAQVPQSTSIQFGFTCLEVVLMGRHPHLGRFAIEGARDHEIATGAMAATGTGALADRPIAATSGGERQRVIAARALAQQPRLLLLDEPTANLDVQHQLQLLELVRGLARRRGVGAVAAIHDLELAARYCDRLLLLSDGRVLAAGTPGEVLTTENLAAAFGVRTLVRTDSATGELTIAILGEVRPTSAAGHVHVVAGGGSGPPIHQLLGTGYRVSVGILAESDADYDVACALGADVVAVPPFSPIDAAAERRHHELVSVADCVLVAATAFGPANLASLEAARSARRVVLVDPDGIAARDYTGGRAAAIVAELRPRAVTATRAGLLEAVAAALATGGPT